MITKASLLFGFALAFAFFILVPPFLGIPFPAYPSMHWADVIDLLTPLVLLPLYGLLFTDSGRRPRGTALWTAFLALGALWTLGQGMHLAANSIGNLQGSGTSSLHDLVHFYDEVLSHYLWHAAIVGLSVLLVLLAGGGPASTTKVPWALMGPAVILYGFTYFAAVNEGGTVPLGLPAAIGVVALIVVAHRGVPRDRNLATFFFLAYSLAVLLFIGWYAYWGGFPEFSETGLL